MRKFLTYLFVLIVTFLLGLAFYSVSPTAIAEREVLSLTSEIHKAEINGDEARLSRFLADEIFYSHYEEGKFITKEDFIFIFRNPEFKIHSIETHFVFTKIEDNQVKVYFLLQITFIGEDGKPFDHVGDYTYTFEKQMSEWKLTSIHFERN